MSCELCDSDGGKILLRDDLCRVVRPALDGYPGFLRVIVNRHVKEMTDLAEREQLMRVVFACESALRTLFQPEKVNLASFGNVVPHVHWHVIARFVDDAHFPDAIWAPARRSAARRPAVADETLARAIMAAL